MDNSSMASLLLKNEGPEVLDSLSWVPNSPPSFHASASTGDENTSEKPFFAQMDAKLEDCDEEFNVCFHQPEKKRRLSHDQVRFLEKSFEVENKLEPERKIQLAKELGLQPRQVAIWFQNRRARYKTKVLEKEYASLKASYDKLKADYDTLFQDNENMKNQVNLLREKLLMRGGENAEAVDCKQEEAKSDVLDSESPHCSNSQEEDDTLSKKRLVPFACFPKLEMEGCDDLQPNSCNLGFPVQDQGTWFWQY